MQQPEISIHPLIGRLHFMLVSRLIFAFIKKTNGTSDTIRLYLLYILLFKI